MPFDPVTAVIRFGLGLSPRHPIPASMEAVLATLRGPDVVADQFPIPWMDAAEPTPAQFAEMRRASREARGTDREDEISEATQVMRRAVRQRERDFLRRTVARALATPIGLRERLAAFWADHFTIRADVAIFRHHVSPFIEEAIRPHVVGRFADMLKAVVMHPMMLLYLNQTQSMGPGSPQAQRRDRGLNENLAREVMELHTLGVDGPYTQTDVRELAELLTGLSFQPDRGFVFRDAFVEPGAEVVLGRSYGGTEPNLADIEAVLEDLALHPATAQHLARKIATHFISDAPSEALVAELTQVYRDTGSDLGAVVEQLLSHPDSWGPPAKAKQPMGFVLSGLRALGVEPASVLEWEQRYLNQAVYKPLNLMGQTYQRPRGPDGWPDTATDWITPQGMAGRISWAMRVPQELIDPLPDPRDFVETALGPNAPQDVTFAAGAAERVRDGVGLVLASAAFQWR